MNQGIKVVKNSIIRFWEQSEAGVYKLIEEKGRRNLKNARVRKIQIEKISGT